MHTGNLAVAAFAVFSAVAAIGGNVKWTNYAVNTPDTDYDWNTPGNWQNEVVGASGDDVNIWISSESVYIKLDSTVTPRLMNNSSASHAFLLGDVTFTENPNGAADNDKRAYILGGYYYGDVTFPSGLKKDPYIGGKVKFCGRLLHQAGVSYRATMPSGEINFCFNRFARRRANSVPRTWATRATWLPATAP